MATDRKTSIKRIRKRAAKKAHKLTKKARKLAMRAAGAVEHRVGKKHKSSKGKKGHGTAVPG